MKGKLSILVVLFSLLLMCFTVSAYAAPPAVDGFAGALWGASREQVQAAMAEKGFTLIGKDMFKGTFVGHSATLYFSYEKNRFIEGQATFLDVDSLQSPFLAKTYYDEIKGLYAAKYGHAIKELEFSDMESWYGEIVEWDLTATATPPGLVTILVIVFENEKHKDFGVYVKCGIGEAWANLKADGSGI